MPQSLLNDVALRDEVHLQLAQFLGPGGDLEDPPPSLDLHTILSPSVRDDIGRRCLAEQPDVEHDGKVAIVTAGPPGAGKSTRVDTIPGRDGYRHIDSDDIKSRLLDVLSEHGVFDDIHRVGQMLDGQPILLYELSGWVHSISTDLQRDLIRSAILRGENVLIEGTLGWDGLVDRYGTWLEDAEYERIDIIDVEVSLTDAIENVRQRWWKARCRGGSGGRFMADERIADLYPADNQETSKAVGNADALFDWTRDTIHFVRLERTHRGADGTEVTCERISVDGDIATDTFPLDPTTAS